MKWKFWRKVESPVEKPKSKAAVRFKQEFNATYGIKLDDAVLNAIGYGEKTFQEIKFALSKETPCYGPTIGGTIGSLLCAGILEKSGAGRYRIKSGAQKRDGSIEDKIVELISTGPARVSELQTALGLSYSPSAYLNNLERNGILSHKRPYWYLSDKFRKQQSTGAGVGTREKMLPPPSVAPVPHSEKHKPETKFNTDFVYFCQHNHGSNQTSLFLPEELREWLSDGSLQDGDTLFLLDMKQMRVTKKYNVESVSKSVLEEVR